MVVEAEVKEEQGRPLIGVNGVVSSKKDLTGPTLLEMSGYATQKLTRMLYTSAMARYKMPAQSPYQRSFRIFAWVATILVLVILCFSFWTPAQFSDETRKVISYGAGAIVAAAIVIGSRLGIKEGLWKLKRGYQVELSDGKLIQRRLESPVVEISVDQIASLQQGRGGWFIITGGEPKRQIAVPSEIVGFESLKREISANRVVSPLRVKLSPWIFMPSASLVLACIVLFASHNRTVVMAAGGATLLLQGLGIFSLRQITRSSSNANVIALISILSFLMLAWVVYERVTSRL